jgi:hypothetical protein
MLVVVALVFVLMAPTAVAAPKSYGQGDALWHQGELDKAKELYEAALEEGGLEPNEVVIAYSRIGTVRAAMRDSKGALSAFRVAAAIDPEFELPADSGPVAKKLYAQARKEAAQGGERLTLKLELPESIKQKRAFTVETEIPPGYAVLVQEVVVTIEDPATGKKWRRNKPSEPNLTFEFPERVAIPGARLNVKAAAIDPQKNAWAVSEGRLKVQGTRPSNEPSPFDDEEIPAPKKDPQKDDSIFTLDGPLPWIIGGAVILGGILIYAATRPTDEVTVGSPAWR